MIAKERARIIRVLGESQSLGMGISPQAKIGLTGWLKKTALAWEEAMAVFTSLHYGEPSAS